MAGFTKLFSSILDSTIWQEPNETRILWITMLAMGDHRGEVQSSIPGLARRAGITLAECEAGLACLSSPDDYSRTRAHEGRRIEEIDGGWKLLNHGKYRALMSAEERREYNRLKQAQWRADRKTDMSNPVNDMSMTVNDNKQCQHSTEAEAESSSNQQCARAYEAPKLAEVTSYAKNAPVPISEAAAIAFYDTQAASGWITKHGHPIADWRAALRRYSSIWNENEKSGRAPSFRTDKPARVVDTGPRKADITEV